MQLRHSEEMILEESDPKGSAGTAAIRRLERRRRAVVIQRADARTRLCQSLGPQTRPAVRHSLRTSCSERVLRARKARGDFADTVGVQVAPGAVVGTAPGAEWREVLLRRRVAAPDFLASAGLSGTAVTAPRRRVQTGAQLPLLSATAPARVGVEESHTHGGAPGLLQRLRVGAEPRTDPARDDTRHAQHGLCRERPALLQLGGATRTLDRAVFYRVWCEDDAYERAAAVVTGCVRRLLALRGEWHAHLRRRRRTASWCSPSQGAWEMHGEAVSRGVSPILTVFGLAADGVAQVLQRWARSIARSQRVRERRAATTIQLLARRAAAKLAARTRHAARTQILAAQCLQRAWQCRKARGAASLRAQQSRAPGSPRTAEGRRPLAGLAVVHQVRVARQTVLLLQGASAEVLAALAPWQSHARGTDRGGRGAMDSGGQVLRSHTATGLQAESDPGNAYCLNQRVPEAARPGFLQVPAADGDRGGRADTGGGGGGGRGMELPGDESTGDARSVPGDGRGAEWDVRRRMDSQYAGREEVRGMGEVRRLMEEADELLDAVMVSQARLERDMVLGILVEHVLDARHSAYQRKDSRLKDAMRATGAAAQGVREGGVRGGAGGGGDVVFAQDDPQALTLTRGQTHANTHAGSQQTRGRGSSREGKTFTPPPPSHSVPSSSTPLGEAEVEALCARRRRGDAAEERALRDAISSLASLLGSRRRYVSAVGAPGARADVDIRTE